MLTRSALASFCLALAVTSCNTNEGVETLLAPEIIFEGESTILTTKVGERITIEPTVKNNQQTTYSWTLEGKKVSDHLSYSTSFDQNGSYYLSFEATNSAGSDLLDLRIDVAPLSVPVISLTTPPLGFMLLQGEERLIEPTITAQEVDEFECNWFMAEKLVGRATTYTFSQTEVGHYPIRIEAANADGKATPFEFNIEVVDAIPYSVEFTPQSYIYQQDIRTSVIGRALHLRATPLHFTAPEWQWSINGEIVEGASSAQYIYTPSSSGTATLTVSVNEKGDNTKSATAQVEIITVEGSQDRHARPATAQSSATQNAIYEFIPAPGQYIGEPTLGYAGDETTHPKALKYAEEQLSSGGTLSLGAFGGYIVVGFDHSVVNGDGDDFLIYGNAFDSGSEAGVVWVMQDLNANGLPDDVWYELRGSESGKESTIQEYSVTYYRPTAPRQDIKWVDSNGASGTVDYWGAYHAQDSYYPTWIEQSSYTLSGTRLEPRNKLINSIWNNQPYDWGYADNFGSDSLEHKTANGTSTQANSLDIDNAMQVDGTRLNLSHIDFVKVQSAVNSKSGYTGEISTEFLGILDKGL